MNSSKPQRPCSRPRPLCLKPPNGPPPLNIPRAGTDQPGPSSVARIGTGISRTAAAALDDDCAGADLARHVEAARGIAGHDHPCEPEVGVVGDPYRLVLTLVSQHGQNRAEHFFLADPHVVAAVDECRRLVEEPLAQVCGTLAADHQRGSFVERRLHIALDSLPLLFTDQRTDHRGRVARITDSEVRRHGLDALDVGIEQVLR